MMFMRTLEQYQQDAFDAYFSVCKQLTVVKEQLFISHAEEQEINHIMAETNKIETILYHLIITPEDEHKFAEITKAVENTENID